MAPKTYELLQFLKQSPTPYHAVSQAINTLEKAGFKHLPEQDAWGEIKSGQYYLSRNDSSLIAFNYKGNAAQNGFRLVGAHTDSPCLKVKPNAITVNNGYAKLALEVYGGVLLNPWFDRDLGLAGRVCFTDNKGQLKNRIINFDNAIAFIPSLAIHLDRDVNDNRSINKQKHLPAVLCRADKDDLNFEDIVSKQIKKQYPASKVVKIMAHELALYDLQAPSVIGLNQEFIASARLDNLLSCYAAIEGLIESNNSHNQMIVLNDHEEVGSASTSGAEGPFLESVLSRICGDEESYRRAISHSMLISADNAHGVHPNYADVHEPGHHPLMNKGPVIKINNNQRYATNSETEALFKSVCEFSKVPYQMVVVRSDMGCGSTIGPITATKLGVRTVDIGVSQLGMHSIRELAGAKDQAYLLKAIKAFFNYKKWPF